VPARCLLGYGLSDKAGDVSLGVHNRLLCDCLDHCGLEAPATVGHDFGGTTVLRTCWIAVTLQKWS
jgi:pimeloyl-ACP methyl ester carboxylesterase